MDNMIEDCSNCKLCPCEKLKEQFYNVNEMIIMDYLHYLTYPFTCEDYKKE